MPESLLATSAAPAVAGLGAASSSPARSSAFLAALGAQQPDAALASKLDLYSRFVGSWDIDIDYRPLNGPAKRATCEWHFSWVLEGRAIQDVFIFPARSERVGKPQEPWWFYGSTFRWFDPAIDAWHITFYEPTRPFALQQIGRAEGADIVQRGGEVDGVSRCWRFVDITATSFRWTGEASTDKGATWVLEMEMHARRAA